MTRLTVVPDPNRVRAARRGGRLDAAFRGLSLVTSGSLVLLLVLPLVALLASAPAGGLLQAAGNPAVLASLGFTLLASAMALLVSVVLGVPLGYVLARRSFRGKSIIESLVTLPIVLPHLIAGLALLLLFAPDSPVGALAARAGFPVFDTIWGVVLVMVYVSASYTVLASQAAFHAVGDDLVEVSRSLGASPRTAFATVTLPIAFRGISAGAVLSWARSVSEIGGFLILAYTVYPAPPYGGPVTAPVSVYVYNLYQMGDLPGATAVASLLVLVAFLLFLLVRLGERRWFPNLFERRLTP
jgi:molybdate/tungstate transport system permease protein